MDQRSNGTLLKARIAELEEENSKLKAKGFWSVTDWKDLLKIIGLPLAFLLALYTAYDDVYLRLTQQRRATASDVTSNLRELQGLNAGAHQLRADGEENAASAFEAATTGLRQRLVDQAFEYWTVQPAFFQSNEAQMLSNELLIEGRTLDAAQVAQALVPDARTARDRSELALLNGRIHGAQGDAFDLEVARQHLREAAQLAHDIPISSEAQAVLEQVVYYRVHMELLYEQECDYVAPMVQVLRDMSLDASESSSSFDDGAAKLFAIYEGRCQDGLMEGSGSGAS